MLNFFVILPWLTIKWKEHRGRLWMWRGCMSGVEYRTHQRIDGHSTSQINGQGSVSKFLKGGWACGKWKEDLKRKNGNLRCCYTLKVRNPTVRTNKRPYTYWEASCWRTCSLGSWSTGWQYEQHQELFFMMRPREKWSPFHFLEWQCPKELSAIRTMFCVYAPYVGTAGHICTWNVACATKKLKFQLN